MPQTELTTRVKVFATAGVMLALLLAALDQTIVGTALARNVAELNGLDRYTWLITVALASIALIASGFMPDIPLRARQPRQQQPAFGELPASPEAAQPEAAVG